MSAATAGEWRTVTDIVNDVINPGDAFVRHANREGLAGRALYSDERKAKMEGGTEVHMVLEAMKKGEEVAVTSFPAARRGYVLGLKRWRKRFDRRILAVEIELESPTLRVRGRTDYVRACQKEGCSCGGEGLVIGDLKVGSLVTYIQAHLQVSGYHRMWLEEEREGTICGGEVLCVNANGDFSVWPVLAVPDDFLFAADWHERFLPLRRAIEEQKGANR